MPKARIEKEISNDGTTRTVEVEVGERGVTKTAQYSVPANMAKFQEFVLNATISAKDGDESDLARIYRLYVTAVDRAARASVYESLAQESTEISVPGVGKVDLLTLPLKNLLKGINGARGTRDLRLMAAGVTDVNDASKVDIIKAVDKGLGFGPWRTAAKELVESGKARENDASGMLEAV